MRKSILVFSMFFLIFTCFIISAKSEFNVSPLNKYYGGSASATARTSSTDRDGNIKTSDRVISVTVGCAYSTISDAKQQLKSQIYGSLSSSSYTPEKLVSSINYDIDSCGN